ncbi:hypothetical protein ABZX75_15930 [Streptomyces sp. NPDC003038]|uniref:hypothetical protein n=1 Tax=unclassified Streptomyces TaxID=2593676 RepID=UPI0033B81FA0
MDTTKTPAPTAPESDSSAEPGTPADADTAGANTPADLKKAEADAQVKAEDKAEGKADAAGPADTEPTDAADEDLDDDFDDEAAANEERSAGVGAGAGAVVAAGLGLVALSGSWVSRVIAERQNLIGQIEGSKTSTPAEQIAALYGDSWHLTALVNGVLSTLALLIAVFVLALPAFATPGRTLPAWVRSVAWAAVAIGALGVLLFGLMYFDVLVPLPTVPTAV